MFADRTEAGERLANRLAAMHLADPVVYALPRGGVPVALPVARALGAPLDLLLVRKIGAPGQPELAAGAVVEGADPVWNTEILAAFDTSPEALSGEVEARRAEIATRRAAWLGSRPPAPIANRTAVLVDDGIATGATVRAGLLALRDRGAARVVLAVPVAPRDVATALIPLVDDLVCLATPAPFVAVGAHYRDFAQVPDERVSAMLASYSRGG